MWAAVWVAREVWGISPDLASEAVKNDGHNGTNPQCDYNTGAWLKR
jgi:hypothetical protein